MECNFYFFGRRSMRLLLILTVVFIAHVSSAQQSVARQWSEVMLNCIRKDYARPTVQARTIAHCSWAMYDAWAVYDDQAEPYLLGNTVGSYTCPFNGVPVVANTQAAQEMAMSYAMYRLLTYRFQTFTPPGSWENFMSGYINNQMTALEYDPSITSTDYSDGDPAKLGNYIAQQLIAYGLTDGTNRVNNHSNQYYFPVNGNIWADLPGNPECYDPNRWQPLALNLVINDQTGFPVPNGAPALTPEWGDAVPFALTPDQLTTKQRDGHDWNIYLNPGDPPYLDTTVQTGLEDLFKWGYVTNIIWHSFHTTADNVMVDISPNNIGNLQTLPETLAEYPDFYDMYNGGPDDPGYTVNPATGVPYDTQVVPRGDYTRVLSEYWADGPSSETPPGHWVKIFNEVSDHPMLIKRWQGQGEILSDLEWDVRGYFAICSGMYDAAIACWSAKGYYDYTRPIMAIRYMASKGQSTNPMLPHYHPAGLPLIPGYIELVNADDPLAGENLENLHKIKLYTWTGPLVDTEVEAGVDWILGENWMTFQKRNFVTPPFPGFYSGHSTYSRTAAEIMQRITGDEYFPGGMSEFVAIQNQYLGADQGPSVNIHLQWAKYKDASDQCSLSRIYGGLHPPQDDVAGRKVGMIIGPQVFGFVDDHINSGTPHVTSISSPDIISDADANNTVSFVITYSVPMNTSVNPVIAFTGNDPTVSTLSSGSGSWSDNLHYVMSYDVTDANIELNNIRLTVAEAVSAEGKTQLPAIGETFRVDTRNPVATASLAPYVLTDASVSDNIITAQVIFDEAMNTYVIPQLSFPTENASASLTINSSSAWINSQTFNLIIDGTDANQDLGQVDIALADAMDVAGNTQIVFLQEDAVTVQTKNPEVVDMTVNIPVLTQADFGVGTFEMTLSFDEEMDVNVLPQISFPVESPEAVIAYNNTLSEWSNPNQFVAVYDMADVTILIEDIDVMCVAAADNDGNLLEAVTFADMFSVNTTVGIDRIQAGIPIRIYPNPAGAGNDVTVELQSGHGYNTVTVYNTVGQRIYETSIAAGKDKLIIPVSSISSGTCFLRFSGKSGTVVTPLQIIR